MSYSDQHYGDGSPDCAICGGVGWLRYEVADNHPDSGKVFRCKECLKPNEIRRLTGLLDPEVWARGDDYYHRLPLRKAIEDAAIFFVARLLAEFKAHQTVSGWASLIGAFGCGKTTWAEKAVVDLTNAGVGCLYVDDAAFDLAMRDDLQFDLNDRPTLVRRMIDTPFLVADQVFDFARNVRADGAASYAGHWASMIGRARYRDRQHKATLIIVNLDWWEAGGDFATKSVWDRMQEFDRGICAVTGLRHILGKEATAKREAGIAAMERGMTFEQAMKEGS